jgi:hypothetical protein
LKMPTKSPLPLLGAEKTPLPKLVGPLILNTAA